MIKLGLVGLGKMGLSHLAIAGGNPGAQLTAVCDSNTFILGVLEKYGKYNTYSNLEEMLDSEQLDGLIIATPTRLHAPMVRAAIDRGLHVFCEKPFCLSPEDSEELAALAASRQLVTQVGYHNRYVGAFAEAKRLVDAGAIGRVTHVIAEAYGPVVLKPKGGTWRARKSEGGGCLYDYAAHPLNLVNWCFGEPSRVRGSVLASIFSKDTDDSVLSTLEWDNGMTCHVSVNWSDESQRKMTTRLTVYGTAGRIYADRQECQAYLRENATLLEGYSAGWNVKYTTSLTEPVSYYLRGEEYSAQLADFVARIREGRTTGINDFGSSVVTDRCLDQIIKDANGEFVSSARHDDQLRTGWAARRTPTVETLGRRGKAARSLIYRQAVIAKVRVKELVAR